MKQDERFRFIMDGFVPTPQQVEQYIADTEKHIDDVRRELLYNVIPKLEERAEKHDASKLVEPELSGFIQLAEAMKLSDHAYGSPEYRENLARYKTVILEHYRVNDHHPEHFSNPETGEPTLAAMDLLSILEWLCDGFAASQRHGDKADYAESLWIQRERFSIQSDLFTIIWHTAVALGFVSDPDGHEFYEAHARCKANGRCQREVSDYSDD